MQIQDLMTVARFDLRLVAGKGGLNRTVTWAHTSELLDPTPFLEGGAVLLSVGILFPDDPDEQVAYAERLDRGQIAGFGISISSEHRLSQELKDAADRLALPLFIVPHATHFAEVVRAVSAANEQVSQRRHLTHLQIYDTLEAMVRDNLDLSQTLDRLERLTGYEFSAMSLDGQPLLKGVLPLPHQEVRRLPIDFQRIVSIDQGYILPIFVSGKVRGALVATAAPRGNQLGVGAVRHVATLVGIEVAKVLQFAVDRASWLGLALSDELQPRRGRTEELIRAAGIDTGRDFLLVAVEMASGEPVRNEHLRELGEELWAQSTGNLLIKADTLFLLVNDDRALRASLESMSEFRFGLSAPFGHLADLSLARREALLALVAPIVAGSGEPIRDFDSAALPVLLPTDRASLERWVGLVLGPVLEYDRRKGTALVESLRCYLKHSRRVQQAAAEMFVHPNTLAYRLKRIEGLAGVDLGTIEGQTCMWLALEAHRLVGAPESSTPLEEARD